MSGLAGNGTSWGGVRRCSGCGVERVMRSSIRKIGLGVQAWFEFRKFPDTSAQANQEQSLVSGALRNASCCLSLSFDVLL